MKLSQAKTKMGRRVLLLLLGVVVVSSSSSQDACSMDECDSIDEIAKKYQGQWIPGLCGWRAPEWMRESRLCDRVVEDSVLAEYSHLGNALQTAKSANLYRMIWSAGSAIASGALAGAGMVACVGSCGQLCPGPTGLAGLGATAVVSAADAIDALTHCDECDEIEKRQHELESRQNSKVLGEMSAEAIQEANEMFDAFDLDENGIVTAYEISFATEELGEIPDPLEIDELIRASDINGDQVLDRVEFLKSMQHAGLDGEILIY